MTFDRRLSLDFVQEEINLLSFKGHIPRTMTKRLE